MELEAFKSRLEAFDWDYASTTSPQVYWSGERLEQALKDDARMLGRDAQMLYVRYKTQSTSKV